MHDGLNNKGSFQIQKLFSSISRRIWQQQHESGNNIMHEKRQQLQVPQL